MRIKPDQLLDQIKRRLIDEGNLQEGLSDIFNCISEIVPVWKISWLQYHRDLRLMRIIAQVLRNGGETTNFMYETSSGIIDLACSRNNPDIYIVNQPQNHPVGKEISMRAAYSDWSAVFIIFKNVTGSYASVMITAEGKDRFTEEHARLLLPLRESLQMVLDILIAEHEKKNLHPFQKEPVDDRNEFFRQVTRRLCGNLDLEIGVTQCLQYLSRFLPADGLFVSQTEPELLSERMLAESYGFFRPQTESLIPLATEEPLFGDGKDYLNTRILNQLNLHPFAKTYTQLFGEDISLIVMPLIHKGTRMGIALLGLEGKKHYNEEHRRLFEMLHDPFVLALSNNIKHREVLRLKDMVEAEKRGLQEELRDTRSQTIIGAGLGLKGVVENALLVAGQDSPVLLMGETGAGKEVVANFIHQKSARKDGPFIKVNCGAIPDTLVDSELFGHEKGAFTGATSRKKGRFERANGGTIFLDEVGELPLQAQVRLLRVLQNKIIERVGGTENIPVNIRIIAATNRNIEEMVASGRFREDLWFRLNVFPIRIPPLRCRRSDIPALVDHFIKTKSRELNIHREVSLSPGAMKRLTDYDWPGNVRELENVIERELILGKGKMLSFQNVIQHSAGDHMPEDDAEDDDFPDLDEAATRHINKALALSHGKINGPGGAAELLKIKPNTLRSRMKKMGIPYGWKK
ncbi:MAG TPA: sigma-54 dependent transcriptional regulator [Smithella sp.]|nr:sigma-54-dependent Fis family transcriptional regulator [Smithella sp.]MDM7985922.1 sigma-54 dependent transcriptional regulator [Smithella sp.]HNY50789.1 sigma-54 dependent transcriptional regulator [Smithella sp.]HOG90729.1 sigma-54 dependent transcriptional regulator [Smithella sp.]HOU50872.1 sigma-54 dependent transcriptional regulator [Smithella sp.]